MPPSISIRESIRWLPDEASEPTSTVVTTSAEHRFVDIRILLPSSTNPSAKSSEDVLPITRLEWGFSGTSSSTIEKGANGGTITHSTWKHWIDSRHISADGVSDEGDMTPMPNGRTLETGNMVNPATGKPTDYEEVWEDLEPISTASTTGTTSQNPVTISLILHDDDNHARGMVVRVGQYCQGIVRVGKQIALERWKWELDGGWRRECRIGDLWIPCGLCLEPQVGGLGEVGARVEYGDYVWYVAEKGGYEVR